MTDKERCYNQLVEVNRNLQEEMQHLEAEKNKVDTELAEINKDDARENAPYQAKLQEVATVNRKLKVVSAKHAAWEKFNVDSINAVSDTVRVGSGVRLLNQRDNKSTFALIVVTELSDAVNGALSETTPVGKAIMGKRSGDSIPVRTPSGTITYLIEEVQ